MLFFFSLFVCYEGARCEIDLRMKNVGLGGNGGMREAGLLCVCVARGPGVCGVLCVIISCVLFGSVMMTILFRVWSGD
jgi:hypothetical protein